MKINWINSWNSTNKKRKYHLELRVGTVTLLEVRYTDKFRLMVLNFGFEI